MTPEDAARSSQVLAAPPGVAVGDLVRARRRELRFTLDRVAQDAGCSKSYLSAIETGRQPTPSAEIIERLETALMLPPGRLAESAAYRAAPESIRRELGELRERTRAARGLVDLLRGDNLDGAFRSGELRALIDRLDPGGVAEPAGCAPVRLPAEVPLINRVAAGYPAEFTDLGYPARVADEYVRCPDLHDADAFAARVVGDSMLPDYREGDIVIFSPAKDVRDGSDCFARIEPDAESTFKRVFFDRGAEGEELVRLQPLNPRYPPRTLAREQVAGLYAAVSVMRQIQ